MHTLSDFIVYILKNKEINETYGPISIDGNWILNIVWIWKLKWPKVILIAHLYYSCKYCIRKGPIINMEISCTI